MPEQQTEYDLSLLRTGKRLPLNQLDVPIGGNLTTPSGQTLSMGSGGARLPDWAKNLVSVSAGHTEKVEQLKKAEPLTDADLDFLRNNPPPDHPMGAPDGNDALRFRLRERQALVQRQQFDAENAIFRRAYQLALEQHQASGGKHYPPQELIERMKEQARNENGMVRATN